MPGPAPISSTSSPRSTPSSANGHDDLLEERRPLRAGTRDAVVLVHAPTVRSRAVSPTTYRDNRCRRTDRRCGPCPAPGCAIVATWFPLRGGDGFPHHSHPQHQLAWTAAGALTDRHRRPTPGCSRRRRALFIPAGCEHATRAAPDARLCGIYFAPEPVPAPVAEPDRGRGRRSARRAARRTSPTTTPTPAARRRAEAVVFDQLAPAPTTTLHLPEPTDERAGARRRGAARRLHRRSLARGMGTRASARATARSRAGSSRRPA